MAANEERQLRPTPEAEALYRRWIAHLSDEFARNQSPDRRAEIVRDELHQLYLGRPHGGRMNLTLSSEWGINVLAETFDPRNAVLRAEYYDEIDVEKFAPRKPLIWFWQMFDRSPLGLNTWLGLRFRCMLGHHIFAGLGKGVKIYRNVDFLFGYNVTIEDNCTLGRGVTLNDRGTILVLAGTCLEEGQRVEPAAAV